MGFVEISRINGSLLPPSISISAFGYFCCSCLRSASASASFPIFARTFVPSGVCVTLMEYPLSGNSLKKLSVSSKIEFPKRSSIMLLLRFTREDIRRCPPK